VHYKVRITVFWGTWILNRAMEFAHFLGVATFSQKVSGFGTGQW